MSKQKWDTLPYERKTTSADFSGGLNTAVPPIMLKEDQAAHVKNLTAGAHPAVRTRARRRKVDDMSYPVNGTVFNYIPLTNGETTILYYENTANSIVWLNVTTNEAIAIISTGYRPASSVCYSYEGGSTKGVHLALGPNFLVSVNPYTGAKIQRATDFYSNYIATDGVRMYGGSSTSNYLYISAKNDYNNWRGADTAMLKIENGRTISCSGLVHFNDKIIYFTENSMHELYGSTPENFAMKTVSNSVGCIAHLTICEIDGVLYWLGKEGVYSYKGGTKPKLVSDAVKSHVSRPSIEYKTVPPGAGTDGVRYYLSFINVADETESYVLVYDTKNDVWHMEDNPGFVQFEESFGKFYGMTMHGEAYEIERPDKENSAFAVSIGDEPNLTGYENDVEWEWHSKLFSAKEFGSPRSWHRIGMQSYLEDGAELKCTLVADSGLTFTADTIIGDGTIAVREVEIPLGSIFGARHVQIRLSGSGLCRLYGLEMKTLER